MLSNDRGFIWGELLLWLGLVALGTHAIQVKVTQHWSRELDLLQKERVPYTGRSAWIKN